RQGMYELQDHLDHAITTLTQISEAGGSIAPLDAETQAAIGVANETILESVLASTNFDGEAYLERAQELAEKWKGIVTELGYTDEGTLANFLDWYDEPIDLEPFIDRVFEE